MTLVKSFHIFFFLADFFTPSPSISNKLLNRSDLCNFKCWIYLRTYKFCFCAVKFFRTTKTLTTDLTCRAVSFFLSKIAIYFIPRPQRTSKLQKKHSALKKKENIQHFKKLNFLPFFYVCESFLPSWIRIHQLKLMRIHADSDTDSDPQPCTTLLTCFVLKATTASWRRRVPRRTATVGRSANAAHWWPAIRAHASSFSPGSLRKQVPVMPKWSDRKNDPCKKAKMPKEIGKTVLVCVF